jgi:hypothetical protein
LFACTAIASLPSCVSFDAGGGVSVCIPTSHHYHYCWKIHHHHYSRFVSDDGVWIVVSYWMEHHDDSSRMLMFLFCRPCWRIQRHHYYYYAHPFPVALPLLFRHCHLP